MRHFGKYLFAACILIVTVVAGAVIWQQFIADRGTSVCADDVRGYRKSAESALSAAGKSFEQIGVALSAGTSSDYIQQLSRLNPAELLAIKSCDTQCKLLDVCISKSREASAAQACPTEYRDYQERVRDALAFIERLQKYESDVRRAVDQVQAIEETKQKLESAQTTVGSSGGREAILRQNLEAQRQQLDSAVSRLDVLAKGLMSKADGS